MGITSEGNPWPSIFAAETLIMLTSSVSEDGHTVEGTEIPYSQILSLQLLILAELASNEKWMV